VSARDWAAAEPTSDRLAARIVTIVLTISISPIDAQRATGLRHRDDLARARATLISARIVERTGEKAQPKIARKILICKY
jgi:hypothetical protein